jgi:beta-mannosidase
LAEYIKNFRRRMFDSSAAVFWMLNDIWPCSRSWTIIDALNNRTPAFWPVRRAFQRESVVVVRENDTVRIFGVNDGPEIEAELHFGLLELKGAYPFERTIPVKLPGNASTVLAEFSAAEWDTLGITKHVAFARLLHKGSEVARDALVLPFFREMEWPKAQVAVEVANGFATFTSNSFAWRVCLDLDGTQPLSDNFFDVYPGIPTVLPWPESLGEPKIVRWGNP